MSRLKDLTGMRFNRLIVLKRDETKKNRVYWICKCDCGSIKSIMSKHLISGKVKSCGCLHIESIKKSNKKHGMCKTRIYRIWTNIKYGCYNPNFNGYKYYGGRGIEMCSEWKHDFNAFYRWSIRHGYTNTLSIDRINVNGDYNPSNCRWVTVKEQQNNKRNNHTLTYNNKTHTLSEWAEITGLTPNCIFHRVERGWTPEQILTTPTKP